MGHYTSAAATQSDYLAQRRKGRKGNGLSFRPRGEIFLRSLAFARDDTPRRVTWRLCALAGGISGSDCFQLPDHLRRRRKFWTIVIQRSHSRGVIHRALGRKVFVACAPRTANVVAKSRRIVCRGDRPVAL